MHHLLDIFDFCRLRLFQLKKKVHQITNYTPAERSAYINFDF